MADNELDDMSDSSAAGTGATKHTGHTPSKLVNHKVILADDSFTAAVVQEMAVVAVIAENRKAPNPVSPKLKENHAVEKSDKVAPNNFVSEESKDAPGHSGFYSDNTIKDQVAASINKAEVTESNVRSKLQKEKIDSDTESEADSAMKIQATSSVDKIDIGDNLKKENARSDFESESDDIVRTQIANSSDKNDIIKSWGTSEAKKGKTLYDFELGADEFKNAQVERMDASAKKFGATSLRSQGKIWKQTKASDLESKVDENRETNSNHKPDGAKSSQDIVDLAVPSQHSISSLEIVVKRALLEQTSWDPQLDDLVWAKVNGFPWWPAQVTADNRSKWKKWNKASAMWEYRVAYFGESSTNYVTPLEDMIRFNVENYKDFLPEPKSEFHLAVKLEAEMAVKVSKGGVKRNELAATTLLNTDGTWKKPKRESKSPIAPKLARKVSFSQPVPASKSRSKVRADVKRRAAPKSLAEPDEDDEDDEDEDEDEVRKPVKLVREVSVSQEIEEKRSIKKRKASPRSLKEQDSEEEASVEEASEEEESEMDYDSDFDLALKHPRKNAKSGPPRSASKARGSSRFGRSSTGSSRRNSQDDEKSSPSSTRIVIKVKSPKRQKHTEPEVIRTPLALSAKDKKGVKICKDACDELLPALETLASIQHEMKNTVSAWDRRAEITRRKEEQCRSIIQKHLETLYKVDYTREIVDWDDGKIPSVSESLQEIQKSVLQLELSAAQKLVSQILKKWSLAKKSAPHPITPKLEKQVEPVEVTGKKRKVDAEALTADSKKVNETDNGPLKKPVNIDKGKVPAHAARRFSGDPITDEVNRHLMRLGKEMNEGIPLNAVCLRCKKKKEVVVSKKTSYSRDGDHLTPEILVLYCLDCGSEWIHEKAILNFSDPRTLKYVDENDMPNRLREILADAIVPLSRIDKRATK